MVPAELRTMRQPLVGGWGWKIRGPHTKARGDGLSTTSGKDDKLPAAFALHCPCPEHKRCAKLDADQWDPQATSSQGKTTARRDWMVTQSPDTHPLLAGWQHELPLFPEAIAGKEEGEVKRRDPEK